MPVETLVHFIRDSNNLQNQQMALLVLSAMAPRHPVKFLLL
jgi:hypothetical protein